MTPVASELLADTYAAHAAELLGILMLSPRVDYQHAAALALADLYAELAELPPPASTMARPRIILSDADEATLHDLAMAGATAAEVFDALDGKLSVATIARRLRDIRGPHHFKGPRRAQREADDQSALTALAEQIRAKVDGEGVLVSDLLDGSPPAAFERIDRALLEALRPLPAVDLADLWEDGRWHRAARRSDVATALGTYVGHLAGDLAAAPRRPAAQRDLALRIARLCAVRLDLAAKEQA